MYTKYQHKFSFVLTFRGVALLKPSVCGWLERCFSRQLISTVSTCDSERYHTGAPLIMLFCINDVFSFSVVSGHAAHACQHPCRTCRPRQVEWNPWSHAACGVSCMWKFACLKALQGLLPLPRLANQFWGRCLQNIPHSMQRIRVLTNRHADLRLPGNAASRRGGLGRNWESAGRCWKPAGRKLVVSWLICLAPRPIDSRRRRLMGWTFMSQWAVDMETEPVCCLHKIQPQITRTASSVEPSAVALLRGSHLLPCTGTWWLGRAWRGVGLSRSRAADPRASVGLVAEKVRGSSKLLRLLWSLFTPLPFESSLCSSSYVSVNKKHFSPGFDRFYRLFSL